MKNVLIIGAGPVGLTCAHVLSSKLKVTVVYPNKKFFTKSTSQTFKLDNELIQDSIWGNANIWGNQHDTNMDYLGFNCSTSDLPSVNISEQNLQEEIKIANKAWGIKPKYRKMYFSLNLENFETSQIISFRKTRKPKLNLDKVSFVQSNFNSIHFVNTNKVMIDGIEFAYDFMILAAGGLSNVYFLNEMGKQLAPRFDYFNNSLGMGYTNHVRAKILTIKFRKWVRMRPVLWRFKAQKLVASFNYMPAKGEFTDSRITIRLWAISSKSLIHRCIQELGFYKQAELISYIELPQIRSNSIKFVQRSNRTLFFNFQYTFSKETVRSICDRLCEIIKLVSNEITVDEVFLEKYDLESLVNMDSHHHFGSTRMGNNHRISISDNFGLVHKTSNIYVAGTSTLSRSFPDHPTWLATIFAVRSCLQILSKSNE